MGAKSLPPLRVWPSHHSIVPPTRLSGSRKTAVRLGVAVLDSAGADESVAHAPPGSDDRSAAPGAEGGSL
ncbi:hypothetical protein Pmi06nite_05630 [Planotetraspora mira]|uniref:Uncharacterized protein n=1 Tax=Planotetraspora mira TaxID=58121 RepID=A0A8J3TK12_9ACTN|nr:hypothetical protein Pmi06nite_05630 [Planotetraspora mira]